MPSKIPCDYDVGYGKPPRHTRFKKGQSGNPRGRPSGSKNLATVLSEALNELVIVADLFADNFRYANFHRRWSLWLSGT